MLKQRDKTGQLLFNQKQDLYGIFFVVSQKSKLLCSQVFLKSKYFGGEKYESMIIRHSVSVVYTQFIQKKLSLLVSSSPCLLSFVCTFVFEFNYQYRRKGLGAEHGSGRRETADSLEKRINSNLEKIITAMSFHTVGFVFGQLRSCRFQIYFHFLNSTPNTFHTIGHIYPVQMNIYKRLKIPLPEKSEKQFFFQHFLPCSEQ